LKTLLKRTTTSTRTVSSWQREVGLCLTRIRHQHASGSLILIITSSKIGAVAQTDTVTGMICRNMLLDHMLVQMSALRMRELVSSETIMLTLVVVMVSVFSIIWSQESSLAKVFSMILPTQMIPSIKIQQSLLISMV